MRAFFHCLFAVSCLLVADASAQTASISGRVQDAGGQPLPGANIVVEESRLGTAAGPSGQFTIHGVDSGTQTLVVTSLGYSRERKQVQVPTSGTVDLTVVLTELPIEIDELIVERLTMTGGSERLRRIPGSAHYLSPQQLERHGYDDVQRALRLVPGVNIQEEEGFGLRPSIGMRGTGVERTTKITIMEDGVLMAPAPYAAPAAYYFPTMGRMHGVEVRKGSSQIKYGPYTTGGAINMISSQVPTTLSGRADVLYGSVGHRVLHANVGNTLGQVGFLLEGYHVGSDGFKYIDGGGETGFEKTDLLAKLRFASRPGAALQQSLTVKVGTVRETSDETYLGLTESDFSASPYRRYAASRFDQMNTEHWQVMARHVFRPSASLDVTTTVYYNDFGRNWYKLDAVRPTADEKVSISALLDDPVTHSTAYRIVAGESTEHGNALEVKANSRQYYSRGVQTAIGYQAHSGRLRHDVEVGVRYHEDQEDRMQWVDYYRMIDGLMDLTIKGQPGTESNRIEDAYALASYVHYRLEVGRLGITPGVRHENIVLRRSDYGRSDVDRLGTNLNNRRNMVSAWIPGIGVDYQFSESLVTFGGVHKGFSPPGSSAGVDPESSVSYELGGRFRSGVVSAELVGFYSDYSNLLGTDLAAGGGGGTGQTFNGGAAIAGGIEAGLSTNVGPMINWALSVPLSLVYTYTEARFQSDFVSDFGPWGTVRSGDQLPYLPAHQTTATIGAEDGRLGFFVTGRYLSRVRTQAGQGDLDTGNSIAGSFVLDVSMEYALNPGMRLFGSVRNLADEVYATARRPAGLRPGMPRTFIVGMKAKL